MRQQLAEAERGIQNMVNAIQQGIITPATKQRLDELEDTKSRLETAMLQEELERPRLTREQVSFWLHRFRKFDVTQQEQRRRLIDSFVNAIYLYDDKVVLVFNYKDGTRAVSFEEIEQVYGSDFTASAAVKKTTFK